MKGFSDIIIKSCVNFNKQQYFAKQYSSYRIRFLFSSKFIKYIQYVLVIEIIVIILVSQSVFRDTTLSYKIK